MRNMSFSMTTEAVRNRSKTVTRRLGWGFLKPGDLVCAVAKSQGLKKREHVERLAVLRVVSNRREWLADIALERGKPFTKEGFPGICGVEFYRIFFKAPRLPFDEACNRAFRTPVNRIEFEYLDGPS